MGRELYEHCKEAQSVFARVRAATGIDVAKLCFESDEDTLRLTQNAQIALYTCSLAAWFALQDRLPDNRYVTAMAGHSVGEYAALAGSGALALEDGARLVKRRGELMAECGRQHPGSMAAVLGLDRGVLQDVCREVDGIVVVANDNCPGQLVISGETDAVRRSGELAVTRGAKRVIPLNVSGAFHSPLMEEAARAFSQELARIEFHQSPVKVYANVTSEHVDSPQSWQALLAHQLEAAVRWTETITHMLRVGVDKFVECGSGEVLSGLIRRIDKGASTYSVSDMASLQKAVDELG